jgi:hypothetical protein
MEREQIINIANAIRTKIVENNKERKQTWELQAHGVKPEEKAEAQADCKRLADQAKEEQRNADDYDRIALHAGSNHYKFGVNNDRYAELVHNAQSHNINKQDIANKIRAKLGRGEVSEACECFMNCMK